MKIRHVLRGRCDPRNADGIIRHTYNVAQAQRRLGHDVAVIGLGAHIDQPEDVDRDGLTVQAFPSDRNPFRTPTALRRRIEAEPAEIYHIQIPFDPAGFALGRTLRRMGLPYVLSPHSNWSPYPLRRKRLKKAVYATLFERPLTRSALAVHATAAAESDDITAFAPFARVFVVRSAIDIDRIRAQIRSTTIWTDQFGEHGRVYVFLGRLDPDQKGLDILLRGWAKFQATNREGDPRLALIGPQWRSSEAELRELVETNDIGRSVGFVGSLYGSDKYSALAAADVYVQTSRYETTPYSIQEALACGLPALVTPGTNFADPVDKYGAGMSVLFDPEAVATALRTLNSVDEDRLREMSAQAHRLAVERHSVDRLARRLVEAYRAVLDGRPFEDDD